jgi:hypothetical protein
MIDAGSLVKQDRRDDVTGEGRPDGRQSEPVDP